MDDIATREVIARDLWQSIPLECLVCAAAVFLAAGLKLAGLMP
ncbi:hypothetical protein [Methylobacterium sp. WL6]|nr:hypothetical protein [Methylobacterium sp. WL6]